MDRPWEVQDAIYDLQFLFSLVNSQLKSEILAALYRNLSEHQFTWADVLIRADFSKKTSRLIILQKTYWMTLLLGQVHLARQYL